MKYFNVVKKVVILMTGLFLASAGILLTIHASLGPGPWEVLHLGLVSQTGLSLGKIAQITGLLIILVDILLKEFPGWGTMANMYFIGLFIDLIERYRLIPDASNAMGSIVMLVLGIFLMGWGTFFYLSAGLGAGPRDGLMLGLSKRFSGKVGVTRTIIEVGAVGAGMLLGTYPGIGTLVFALFIGPAVQLSYRIWRIDPCSVKHRTLMDDFRLLKKSRVTHMRQNGMK